MLLQFLKVTLDETGTVIETSFFAILVSNLHLVFVDSHSRNISSGELNKVAKGTSDTTADVKNFASRAHASP